MTRVERLAGQAAGPGDGSDLAAQRCPRITLTEVGQVLTDE